jgi:uncharacterized protein YegJ (DUF2314 family)
MGCSREPVDLDEIQVDADGSLTFSGLDLEIGNAIDEAKFRLAEFIRTLRDQEPNQSGFAILVPYEGSLRTEVLWVDGLRYDGLTFSGYIASPPNSVPNLRLGSPVTVQPDIVIDWQYVEDGKVVGDFIGAVIKRRIQEGDRVRILP